MSSQVQYWDDLSHTTWGRYIGALEAAAVDAALRDAPEPHRALDVGCGAGRWSRFVLDRGWEVTAVDVEPDAVRLCSERNPEAQVLLAAYDDDDDSFVEDEQY